MIGKKCAAVCKNGKPCNAYALTNSRYCFAHAPGKGAARAAARRLGGLHRLTRHTGDPSSIPENVKTLFDVLAVLDYTLKEIIGLENGIARARSLIALADSYTKVLQVSELEERIKRLEQAYQEGREL